MAPLIVAADLEHLMEYKPSIQGAKRFNFIMQTYQIHITFNKKKFTIKIVINRIDEEDEKRYHYNLEIMTKEQLSGNEFQKLRKYLEDEGYIDAAIEYYKSCLM